MSKVSLLSNKIRKTAGFTLIELMIVLTIAAAILSLAVPGLATLLERNRLQSASNDVFSALMLTRSEALKRNQPVVICKSSNGTACTTSGQWEQGWLIYADQNAGGSMDPNEPVINVGRGLKSGDTLRVSNASFNDQLAYAIDGSAGGSVTFVLCNADANIAEAREIEINITGRAQRNKATADCTP